MKKLVAAILAWAALTAVAQAVTPPPVAARAFILVDALSGQTLAAEGADDRFEPASLAKLMTAYVVFAALRDRQLDESQAAPVSAKAAKQAGSRMFLEAGKAVTVRELLHGLIVQSGNDAAVALAEAAGGSEEGFVALMNRQAERLGLANTRFVNASGAPAPEQHSTARDLATLSLALVRDFPERYPLFAEKEYTYNHVTQNNRNRLLWTDPTGSKFFTYAICSEIVGILVIRKIANIKV